MLTAGHNSSSRPVLTLVWGAATDPVDPVHGYNMPILPFKRPPAREDFPHSNKREKPPARHPEPPQPEDGHVDDYA